MKTQEQKNKAIKKLKAHKKNIPEFSMFGDPNHEAIDAQILVIEEGKDENDIIELWGEEYDEDDTPNHVTQYALEALSWLEGDIELSDLVDED